MSGPHNMLFTDVPLTLASSVPVLALGPNPNRSYCLIQNTGAGVLSIGFNGSSSVSRGLSLDSGGAGRQGGYQEYVAVVPMNAIWLYSAAGTTAIVIEAA